MTYTQDDLDTASRHVREGRERLEGLTTDIELARKKGGTTHHAESALLTMMHTQELLEQHERDIRASLANKIP